MKCIFCQSDTKEPDGICPACCGEREKFNERLDGQSNRTLYPGSKIVTKSNIGKTPEPNKKNDDYVVYQFNKHKEGSKTKNELIMEKYKEYCNQESIPADLADIDSDLSFRQFNNDHLPTFDDPEIEAELRAERDK
jgi:hypothetical protein